MGVSNFSVYTSFKAKDGVSPVFSAITKKTTVLDRVMGKFNLTQKGWGSCIAGTAKKMNLLMNAFVGFFAAGQVKSFVDNVTKASEVQLSAETKLTQALKNNAVIRARGQKEYLKSSKELFDFARGLQNKGVLGDEVILGGMQTLASMGIDDKAIKKVMPVIADLVVQQKGYNASVEDMENASKGIGRAIAGNSGALSRMGVVLDKNQKKQFAAMNTMQRTAYIAEILKQRVGGMNEELAKTDRGVKIQFLNRWGDMLEGIGLKIMPLEGNIFRNLNKHLPTIARLCDKFFNGLNWAIKALNPVFKQMNKLFNYLAVHLIPELSGKSPLLKTLFENVLVPGLTLTIQAIGGLFKAIDGTYNFIKNIYHFVKDNWVGLLAIILPGAIVGTKMAIDTLMVQIALAKMEGIGFAALMNTKFVASILAPIKAIKAITVATKAFTIALWRQAAAFAATPVGMITLGITALIGVVVLLAKNWDWVKEKGLAFCQWVTKGFWGFIDVLKKAGNFLKTHFIDLLLLALGPVGQIVLAITKISSGIRSIKGGGEIVITHKDGTPPIITPQIKNNPQKGAVDVNVNLSNKTDKNASVTTRIESSNDLRLSAA